MVNFKALRLRVKALHQIADTVSVNRKTVGAMRSHYESMKVNILTTDHHGKATIARSEVPCVLFQHQFQLRRVICKHDSSALPDV